MRTFLRIVLAFLGGTIITYLLVVGGLLLYMEANQIFDREGSMGMGFIFVIGPLVGVLGGVASAIAIPIWLNRRDLRRAAGELPPRAPRSQAQQVGIAVLLAGILVYAMGRFVLWFKAEMSFESYWTALAVSYSPEILALAAAALAAFLVSRKAAPQP